MKFTKSLIKGKLVKRYKRFFIDIKLNNKEIIVAHCPNTGSMMGLLDEGNEVFVSKNDDPKRKLKYTIEIIKVKKSLVGVNTHFANKIAFHGLSNNLIKEVVNNDNIKPEVFFDKETRFDFLIEKNKQKIFVEVKNVTLFRNEKIAEFPDSVTSRGSKHLKALIEATKKGYKTYLLFLVQIQGVTDFKIAKDIDKEYYKNYLLAKKAGVNFLAYRCKINLKEIKIEKKIKIING
jgi:sugar fermentation stimulation protein A